MYSLTLARLDRVDWVLANTRHHTPVVSCLRIVANALLDVGRAQNTHLIRRKQFGFHR